MRLLTGPLGGSLAILAWSTGLLPGEDQAPPQASESPAIELGRMRERLDALAHQVEDLQQNREPANAGLDDSIDRRLSSLEAEQHTDSSVALAGSGGLSVSVRKNGDRSTGAQFNPIILYSVRDDLVFVGELNADQGGVGLGQAFIAYTALPHLVVELGLAPLPFAAYSERFSPPWINRMGTEAPPPYADDYGIFAGDQSDVGLQVRGEGQIAGGIRGTYHLFVTQGPSYANPDDPDHPDNRLTFGGTPAADHVPPTVGIRVGLLPSPAGEVGMSVMTGGIHNNQTVDPTIDTSARRSFVSAAVDAEYRIIGIQWLGEYVYADYQDSAGVHRYAQGAYLQAARLFRRGTAVAGALEPVLRAGEVRRVTEEAGYRTVSELGGGLNYYLSWNLRASLIAELHNVHSLDQVVFSTIYAF